MKTIPLKFKTLLFSLLIAFAVASCSSNDVDNDNPDDNQVDLKGGSANATIEVDNKTIQFSTKTDTSFATITKKQIGNKKTDILNMVMMDSDSDVIMAIQVAPAPDKPVDYDVSTVGLGGDYFFSTNVVVKASESSDDHIYRVGSYQQGEEVVIQSKGSFKITSLSKSTIKGTFKMTLYHNYDPKDAQDAEKLTLTGGEFDLPMVELNQEDLEDLGLD